ncbi:MAG: hypothetical protein AB7R55_08900 [Gemmatimonadales bacterium]
MRAWWALLAVSAVAVAVSAVVLAGETPGLTELRITGRMTDPALRESSAAARGLANPDVLWTVDDSGNPPHLFAVDTTGEIRAVVVVQGVTNRDWEALAVTPCDSGSCLLIGDVGDNARRRGSLVVYRLAEPTLGRTRELELPVIDSLTITLPEGPRDIEAMAVSDRGLALFSKTPVGTSEGYWVPVVAWRTGRATAEAIGRWSVGGLVGRGRMVTDAALSPDGERLALRSYTRVAIFERSGDAPVPDRLVARCTIGGREPIGEGIAWWDDRTLAFTSESGLGRAGPIHLGQCDAR